MGVIRLGTDVQAATTESGRPPAPTDAFKGAQPSLFTNLPPIRYSSGVLPSQDITSLIANGIVSASTLIDASQVQPASLDLRLGPIGYRVSASFLPGSESVASKLAQTSMHVFDLRTSQVLERGCIYVIPLLEELALPSDVSALANPKSSTGRLDVFTRLLTDAGDSFDSVRSGYRGKMYLEVVPRTFSIRVREGTRLNQIRFQKGIDQPLSDRELLRVHREEGVVFSDDGDAARLIADDGVWLRIDLKGHSEGRVVGWRAKHHCRVIDLELVDFYDEAEFWEPVRPSRSETLVLNPDDFYILVSQHRVRVPHGYAAEMVPIDPSVGEFRVHYAGFFDPGFGCGDVKGTQAVLEVRSHEVPFLVEHSQMVGRLQYRRLLEEPTKTYGGHIGSSYQGQGLALSKFFRRSA